jgi:hypothetical protein
MYYCTRDIARRLGIIFHGEMARGTGKETMNAAIKETGSAEEESHDDDDDDETLASIGSSRAVTSKM